MKLDPADYEGIASTVSKALLEIFPENAITSSAATIVSPDFFADSLRLSTTKTQCALSKAPSPTSVAISKKTIELEHQRNIDELEKWRGKGSPSETDYIIYEALKKQLTQQRDEKLRQWDQIAFFGQLLFSESAAHYFIDKLKNTQGLSQEIKGKMETLTTLTKNLSVDAPPRSRLEILSHRKEFSEKVKEIEKDIKNISDPVTKSTALGNLYKVTNSYYQLNDLNFKYTNSPSRGNLSELVNFVEKNGARIALGATAVAIVASALAFIPPLTPIMGPIAGASACLALGVGLPVAFKRLGTMLYNMFRFNAAPTKDEIVNAALLGATLGTAGLGGIVANAVGQTAAQTGNAITNMSKTGAGGVGLYEGKSIEEKKRQMATYKRKCHPEKKPDKPDEKTTPALNN